MRAFLSKLGQKNDKRLIFQNWVHDPFNQIVLFQTYNKIKSNKKFIII